MPEPDAEAAARTAWLLRLSVDQVAGCDRETMIDWLIARHDQRTALLRAACRTLRELSALQARAHARLLAALTTPTSQEPTR